MKTSPRQEGSFEGTFRFTANPCHTGSTYQPGGLLPLPPPTHAAQSPIKEAVSTSNVGAIWGIKKAYDMLPALPKLLKWLLYLDRSMVP